IHGLEWIRILYTYPEEITDEFLQTMAKLPKVCHYIDMPIQHASDNILRKMGRRTNHDALVSVINRAREIVPDVILRTTLISGFPSETDTDHEALCDFVREMKFDHLGVFTYSQEEGTKAAEMPDQIDEPVKIKRRDELMQIQEQIAAEKMTKHAGKTFMVLIDGYLPEDDIYVGRTYMDAPEVDGFFYVSAEEQLNSGDMIYAECKSSNAYDLYGEMIKRYESAE
ncbi:MAG: radical SAM protein, partial [Lachnospiraceae bacterium]|nr:radical SAM protein [Lachnospiraceae bacterium]